MAELKVFLPKNILILVQEGRKFVSKKGVVLFCDVAGFTPLTEKLSKIGKEGAEKLTILLNQYFSEMIDIVYQHYGDVLRFGGDAMTLFFDEGFEEESLKCAQEMMEHMEKFREIEIYEEKFSLSMKIGISSGKVIFGLLGDEKNCYDYFCGGLPLDESAESEHLAQKGEIVLHPKIAKQFDKYVQFNNEGFGWLSLLQNSHKGNFQNSFEPFPQLEEKLKEILPTYLIDRAGEGSLGEHRNTTVIFLSFKGLNLPKTKNEEEDFCKQVEKLYKFFILTVKNYGGVLNKIDMGDKGMKAIFLFGSPFAIENKEEMAIRCSLELLQNNPLKDKVTFKMGITTSHLFTGAVGSSQRREFTVMGDGINTAARLMQKAEWGEIICDKKTKEGAEKEVLFKELESVLLKGKEKKIEIYSPVELSRTEADFESEHLIEREEILEKIKNLLMKEGMPILVVGGAGIGKTTLIEFTRKEAEKLKLRVTRVFLAPYHQTRPYSLWKGALRSIIGAKKEDSAEKVKMLAENYLEKEEREFSALLNPPLGLQQEETEAIKNLSLKDRKELTFALLEKVFSKCGEMVILADNIECGDPMSLEFLNFFLEGGRGNNLKIIVSAREIEENIKRVSSSFDILEVKPFSYEGERKYLENNLKLQKLSEKALNFFHSKTAGNPKYINAFFDILKSEGVVLSEGEKFYLDEDRLFKTSLPANLEEIYLKKVDELEREEREIVQSASVLGYSVSLSLLSDLISKDKDYLLRKFNELVKKEIFIYDSWGERPYFKFKDSFLRETVYESAPFLLKKNIHLKCAQFLEKESADNSRVWQLIANHYKGAGEKEKEFFYSKKCAYDALSRYDNVTAMKYLEEICKEGINKENFECAFSLMKVYSNLGKREDEEDILKKIEEQNFSFDVKEHLQFLLFKIKWSVIKGKFEEAETLFEKAEDFAKKNHQISSLAEIYVNKAGGFYCPKGEFEKAKKYLEKCLTLPDSKDIAVFKVSALCNNANILKHQGETDKALESFYKAYRKAARLKLIPQMAIISMNIAQIFYDEGEYKKAEKWVQKCSKYAETFGLRNLKLFSEHLNAINALALGRPKEAKETLIKNLENCKRFNNEFVESLSATGLIESCFLTLELNHSLYFGKRALEISKSIQNGVIFKETLAEIMKLFIALNERKEGLNFTKEENCKGFLEDTPPSPPIDIFLNVMMNYLEGIKVDFQKAISESILERLKPDYFLLMLENSIRNENIVEAEKIVNEVFTCKNIFNYFPNKVKFFLFLKTLKDKRSEILKKDVGKLILKDAFGPYGLRVLSIFWKEEKCKRKKRELRKLFIKRIYELKIKSPDWAIEKVLSFEEIKDCFLG